MNHLDLNMLAQQIAQIQATAPTLGTKVILGVSSGLLRSALEKRSEKAQGGSILFHYRSISGLEMRFADKSLEADAATTALERMHSVACENGAVLEIRGYVSFDLISDMLDMFDDYECSYASVTLELLENRIEAKKAKSMKEEGKWVPSLNIGQVTGVLDFARANNPMADSSELATEDELVALIQEQAVRSRTGYNTWKSNLSDVGKTEGTVSNDQSLTDLA